MRTFVIGDIHGGYRALVQCLERSGFNNEEDSLISLGDICDGWSETSEVISELLTVKQLILCLGNHDYWAVDWMKTGKAPDIWTTQGGDATLRSYGTMSRGKAPYSANAYADNRGVPSEEEDGKGE